MARCASTVSQSALTPQSLQGLTHLKSRHDCCAPQSLSESHSCLQPASGLPYTRPETKPSLSMLDPLQAGYNSHAEPATSLFMSITSWWALQFKTYDYLSNFCPLDVENTHTRSPIACAEVPPLVGRLWQKAYLFLKSVSSCVVLSRLYQAAPGCSVFISPLVN